MESARKYPFTLANVGERVAVSIVFALFFISGSAALLYQVIWQRLLAIFSGADIYSITIIVAAYMAGLGCGSLAGGYIADRVSVRARVILFALAELAIALFAFASKWLYYDLLYARFSYLSETPAVLALVLFASLLWPTFFMGMSLPLLSKALTRRIESAAGVIGSLYAFNTLGAAAGAFGATWLFARTMGFEATIQIGAVLNIVTAAGALALFPYLVRDRREEQAQQGALPTTYAATGEVKSEPHGGAATFPVQVWIAIYCLSGFVALSLEILWFRVLGVMLKSNAFTFGNLLAIFLAGLACGTFLGIRTARTSSNPARTFLALQTGIAAYAGLAILLFTSALGNLDFVSPLWTYFGGYDDIDIGHSLQAVQEFISEPDRLVPDAETSALTFLTLYFVLPIALIGPPTLMMGLSFPFLQKVVQHDMATLGRRVGWLQTANIFGSMLGSVGTGWVFLRLLGISLTLKLLIALGGIFALLYIYSAIKEAKHAPSTAASQEGPTALRKTASTIPAIASKLASTFAVPMRGMMLIATLLLIVLIPDSRVLWAKMHGTTPEKIIAAEDGSGLALLKALEADFRGRTRVVTGGISQSSIPFPVPHITLGLVPAMSHPGPKRIGIIGLGSGATLFAAGGRQETEQIECIEIVAPQLPALRDYYAVAGYGGVKSLLEDSRISFTFTDGRAHIRQSEEKYDIIEADALRPNSAYSGNLYSYEYFELLKDQLKPGGFAVTWSPTPRVEASFLKVFPYVVRYEAVVSLLIGSDMPIVWDRATIASRLRSPFATEYYGRAGIDTESYVRQFSEATTTFFTPKDDRSWLTDFNSDLFPKDEYLVP